MKPCIRDLVLRRPLGAAIVALVVGCGSSPEQPAQPEAEPSAAVEPVAAPTRTPVGEAIAEVPSSNDEEPTMSGTSESLRTGQPVVEPAPAEPGTDGKSFTVIARLVDRGQSTPHCGVIHAVAVMKLEVERVEDGKLTGNTLYIYVSCPEMLPSSTVRRLEEGTSYRVVLDTRIHRPTAGAKFDAFPEVDAPRYRLMKIETVEEREER